MEDKIRASYLYDFYGELLTDHQRQVYEMNVFEDLSLSEIADTMGVSRQGVHDVIKRCDRLLEEYESKLKLVDKFIHIKEDVARISELTSHEASADTLKQIASISNEILEEF